MSFEGPDIYFDDAGEPCLAGDVAASPNESLEDVLISRGIATDDLAEIITIAERTFSRPQFQSSEWLPDLLRIIAAPPATEQQIGRRVLIILHLLGDFESMSALARRLGVSPQRTSQALERFYSDFPMISQFSRKAP